MKIYTIRHKTIVRLSKVAILVIVMLILVAEVIAYTPCEDTRCERLIYDPCRDEFICWHCSDCSCNECVGDRCDYKCKDLDCEDCTFGHDGAGCPYCTGCKDYCAEAGKTCCKGYGECCDPNLCEECVVGGCKVCGGDPNKSCCDGTCYNTETEQCCPDTENDYICGINEFCCNGNCCQYGCCEEELANEWCVTRGCGCDPIGASCSGKTEKEAGPTTAYLTSGTGSKCKIPQGEVLCYRWRSCVEAGAHDFEMCIVLNPDIPQGFCYTYAWPYCRDCEGTGLWQNSMTTSTRCVAP